MKKTHFLALEFHPGDKCWCIKYDEKENTATAVCTSIVRVIHTIDLPANEEDYKNGQNFLKEIYYILADGSTIMKPLRSKEAAEKIINEEMVKPTRR